MESCVKCVNDLWKQCSQVPMVACVNWSAIIIACPINNATIQFLRNCKFPQLFFTYKTVVTDQYHYSNLINQPRPQGLRGETLTKTLVKFVLSFQNFGKTIACAVRHNRIQPLICIILDHAFKIKFWNHRRHIGTPGPVFFAGVRVSF